MIAVFVLCCTRALLRDVWLLSRFRQKHFSYRYIGQISYCIKWVVQTTKVPQLAHAYCPYLLLIGICAHRAPASCRRILENQLTGTLPSELGALTDLSYLCVNREKEGELYVARLQVEWCIPTCDYHSSTIMLCQVLHSVSGDSYRK